MSKKKADMIFNNCMKNLDKFRKNPFESWEKAIEAFKSLCYDKNGVYDPKIGAYCVEKIVLIEKELGIL